jgi:hypothetical protein
VAVTPAAALATRTIKASIATQQLQGNRNSITQQHCSLVQQVTAQWQQVNKVGHPGMAIVNL